MDQMKVELIEAVSPNPNMSNYEQTHAAFDWKDIEKSFSWYETGKVNMAYEAIDRHADSSKKDKIALYYSDSQREEAITYG
ncbi:acetate--CoA ligase, partial [Paenibacillus sp. TAF58]